MAHEDQRLRDYHPLGWTIPGHFASEPHEREWWIRYTASWKLSPASFSVGYSGFARRYSRNLCWFLFLQLMICLSSLGSRAPVHWVYWDPSGLICYPLRDDSGAVSEGHHPPPKAQSHAFLLLWARGLPIRKTRAHFSESRPKKMGSPEPTTASQSEG